MRQAPIRTDLHGIAFATTHAAGSVATTKDAEGNELLNHPAEKAFQSLTFSSAQLALDTEYSVYVDGVRQQYSGNSFGMMGGPGGPGGFGGGMMPGGQRPEGGMPPEWNGQMPTMPEGGMPPEWNGQMPTMPGGFDPSNAGGEGSDVFLLTETVHSFSGLAESSASAGKTRVTFTVNGGDGVRSVASGERPELKQIACVGWAEANGIVQGDGAGHFMPNSNVTSEQMDLILARQGRLCFMPTRSKC